MLSTLAFATGFSPLTTSHARRVALSPKSLRMMAIAAGDVAGGNGAASFGGLQNADDWPFTERECAQILMGVSEALLALHARGIAHRDIKPHNVRV